MGTYTGINFRIKLKEDLPKEMAMWIVAHTQGKGSFPDINGWFSNGWVAGWEHWKGGNLLRCDGGWLLTSNGVCKNPDEQKLAFFLNEIFPWIIPEEDTIVARTVAEGHGRVETIFWYGEDGMVRSRRGKTYADEYWHPSTYTETELKQLAFGKEGGYPQPTYDTSVMRYVFPQRRAVGIATQTKKQKAEAFNREYQAKKDAKAAEHIPVKLVDDQQLAVGYTGDKEKNGHGSLDHLSW
jgi:hypothetical protein